LANTNEAETWVRAEQFELCIFYECRGRGPDFGGQVKQNDHIHEDTGQERKDIRVWYRSGNLHHESLKKQALFYSIHNVLN